MLEEEQVLVCTGWLVLKCRTSPPCTAGGKHLSVLKCWTSPPCTAGEKYFSVLVLKFSVVQAPPCTGWQGGDVHISVTWISQRSAVYFSKARFSTETLSHERRSLVKQWTIYFAKSPPRHLRCFDPGDWHTLTHAAKLTSGRLLW